MLQHGTSQALLYLTRSRDAGLYEPVPDALFMRILPHVRRASQLTLRLASLTQSQLTLYRALDAVRDPLLVVDADARIIFANASAERVIAASDGLAVDRDPDRRGGALRAAVPRETAELRRLIAEPSSAAARVDGPGLVIHDHRARVVDGAVDRVTDDAARLAHGLHSVVTRERLVGIRQRMADGPPRSPTAL
jgi:nitrogen-specific signal transduction histidine kinase